MLEQFRKDSTEITRAGQDDMMQFFTGAMEFNDIKFNELMKSLWVTNELDGSEDNLVSEKLFTFVGEATNCVIVSL